MIEKIRSRREPGGEMLHGYFIPSHTRTEPPRSVSADSSSGTRRRVTKRSRSLSWT